MAIDATFTRTVSFGSVSAAWVQQVVQAVEQRIGRPRRLKLSLPVAVIADKEMRRLNRRYRHQDKPTDVLAFPGRKGFPGDDFGEIVIAVGVCRRQARRHRHSVKKEFTILLIHAVLHLFGYDHQRTADATKMERMERIILKDLYV